MVSLVLKYAMNLLFKFRKILNFNLKDRTVWIKRILEMGLMISKPLIIIKIEWRNRNSNLEMKKKMNKFYFNFLFSNYFKK